MFGLHSSHTPPPQLPPTSWNFGLWLVCETIHKPDSPRDEIEKREVCTPPSPHPVGPSWLSIGGASDEVMGEGGVRELDVMVS